eukprot:PhM_4_TR5410/c0_g1_i1/m.14273
MEVLVLVPMGYAVVAMMNKISRLQGDIADREMQLKVKEDIINSMSSDGASSSSSSGRISAAQRSFVVSTVAISGAVAVASAVKWYARPHRTVEPASNYTPTPASHDREGCVVCLENSKDTCLFPCRHLCVCWGCSRQVDACPLCREVITARTFTYT